MASDTAKKAAGTYIEDSLWSLPKTLKWMTTECRTGSLAQHVRQFCEAQPEIMDPAMVVVEAITGDCIQCRVSCRCYDHESDGTFPVDVRFTLDPQSGSCQRA